MPLPNSKPPAPSSGQTFYNDHSTTTNHSLSSLCATPTTIFPPFPSSPHTIPPPSPQALNRLTAIERKLDSLLFVLSSQSANLTTLSSKFERLCAITGIDVPDEKPVEQRMRDYEMKFEHAKNNAEEAVLERKRTLSDAAAAAAKAGIAVENSAGKEIQLPAIPEANPDAGIASVPVGMQSDRNRAISITRSCRDVKLEVSMRVYVNSVSIVDQTITLPAMQYELFEKLLAEIFLRTNELYTARKSAPEAHGLDLTLALDSESEVKWVLKLDEDGTVANLSKSPTRLNVDDWMGKTAGLLYKGWYSRNVARGKEVVFAVDFRCDLKTPARKMASTEIWCGCQVEKL